MSGRSFGKGKAGGLAARDSLIQTVMPEKLDKAKWKLRTLEPKPVDLVSRCRKCNQFQPWMYWSAGEDESTGRFVFAFFALLFAALCSGVVALPPRTRQEIPALMWYACAAVLVLSLLAGLLLIAGAARRLLGIGLNSEPPPGQQTGDAPAPSKRLLPPPAPWPCRLLQATILVLAIFMFLVAGGFAFLLRYVGESGAVDPAVVSVNALPLLGACLALFVVLPVLGGLMLVLKLLLSLAGIVDAPVPASKWIDKPHPTSGW